MAYITRNQVLTVISANQLTAFLDDDRDGLEDEGLFAATVAAASLPIDGAMAAIYSVPFGDPPPPKASAMCLVFFCEMLYDKRLTPTEKNPFRTRADAFRKELQSIREEGTGFDKNLDRAFTPGFALTADVVFTGTSM